MKVIIKLLETNDKIKILKAHREKTHVKYRETKIRVAAYCLSETMKEYNVMFKEL